MGSGISDSQLKALISAARGEVKADLVLKNAKILNVFTGDTEEGDVAVNGGFIAGIGTYEGKVLGALALPIGGLMCDMDVSEIEEKLSAMKEQARLLGVPEGIDPFMTLAFTALPVIPKLRILTKGVVDVATQSYVPVMFD